MTERHPITGRFLAFNCEIDCLQHCAGLCGITARERAVYTVDQRHGYTYEFSSSPEAHLAEYDEEEQRQSATESATTSQPPDTVVPRADTH